MTSTYILGISAYYHDSAACLLRDGEIVAAAQEERFTREKGDASFPTHAVAYCLDTAGIHPSDLAYVGFYDKPLLKFERILETYLGVAPKGFTSFRMAGPLWMKEKLFTERDLRRHLGRYDGELLFAEHHESHAASAFFPSPFERAAILTMDGVGEWATASIGVGEGNDLRLLSELHWPDSLGLLYSALTYYLGFKVNSGEYKVMGLAPYGEPKYVQLLLDNVVQLREDGSLTLNQKYFDYLGGLTMTNGAFDQLFGAPPRVPETHLVQRDLDIARSVQEVCEMAMLRMASNEYGYGIDPGAVAKIWRAGCIIRASLLGDIRHAFERDAGLVNLLLDDAFRDAIAQRQDGWRYVVQTAVGLGIPVPAMGSSLAYYDSYRAARLPANLTQAQRDFFGAHTYRRLDRDGVFHTNWTGDAVAAPGSDKH